MYDFVNSNFLKIILHKSCLLYLLFYSQVFDFTNLFYRVCEQEMWKNVTDDKGLQYKVRVSRVVIFTKVILLTIINFILFQN